MLPHYNDNYHKDHRGDRSDRGGGSYSNYPSYSDSRRDTHFSSSGQLNVPSYHSHYSSGGNRGPSDRKPHDKYYN